MAGASRECKIFVVFCALFYLVLLLMPFVRVTDYCDIPFCNETPRDSYKYANVCDLEKLCRPTEDAIKVHCLGVLYSQNGSFYLKDFPQQSSGCPAEVSLSVIYLQSPLKSTVVPYPVHIFGDLLPRDTLIILVRILKCLNPSTAIKLYDSMNRIKRMHVAAYIQHGL